MNSIGPTNQKNCIRVNIFLSLKLWFTYIFTFAKKIEKYKTKLWHMRWRQTIYFFLDIIQPYSLYSVSRVTLIYRSQKWNLVSRVSFDNWNSIYLQLCKNKPDAPQKQYSTLYIILWDFTFVCNMALSNFCKKV